MSNRPERAAAITNAAAPQQVRYVLELTICDEAVVVLDGQPSLRVTDGTCATVAELREMFGGETGVLTDPAGDEHIVTLAVFRAGWSPGTTILIHWHPAGSGTTAGLHDPVHG